MLEIGTQLQGRYVIEEQIGQGGMGAVYLAVDQKFSISNRVAIKETFYETPELAEAFEREACGTCTACRRIERGVHPDVIVIEPGDNGSIKIEAVRDVIDRAGYRPFEGRRRVVIIDDAEALVPAAQNALLKTLEEMPAASILYASRRSRHASITGWITIPQG